MTTACDRFCLWQLLACDRFCLWQLLVTTACDAAVLPRLAVQTFGCGTAVFLWNEQCCDTWVGSVVTITTYQMRLFVIPAHEIQTISFFQKCRLSHTRITRVPGTGIRPFKGDFWQSLRHFCLCIDQIWANATVLRQQMCKLFIVTLSDCH